MSECMFSALSTMEPKVNPGPRKLCNFFKVKGRQEMKLGLKYVLNPRYKYLAALLCSFSFSWVVVKEESDLSWKPLQQSSKWSSCSL